jgi:hypothetical protein
VLKDPLTGLRQIFIDRKYTGYFIELIERTEDASKGVFTNNNKAALAQTMIQYLSQQEPGPESADPAVNISVSPEKLLAYLKNPANLRDWTGHRNIRFIDGQWVEVRMHGDVAFAIDHNQQDGQSHEIVFSWRRDEEMMQVIFELHVVEQHCHLNARLPRLDPDRLARTQHLVQTELNMLAAIMEGPEGDITTGQRELVDTFHLEIHQRPGL